MTRKKLLLVEDDRALAELLIWHFEREDFEVRRTGDGEEALLLASEEPPDVIVLDWMIEGILGLEVCRRLRRRSETANVPIIMLTARGEESDRIRGLETGADDYVTKPFSPRELVARVGAVLRRVRPALAAEQLGYEDVEMDVAAHRVRRDGRPVSLGPTEFRLLGISSKILAASFRANGCSTPSGRTIPRSTFAPSTSTSAACARRSTMAGGATSSGRSARPAIRSMPKPERA